MSDHQKIIVTTTINPVTEAIDRYQDMADWTLVVIGDKKTPSDYRLRSGRYIGPEEQEAYDKALSDAIGWNCIQRRNFGFLIAREMGASIVATIDDDNIPYDYWGKDVHVGRDLEVNHYQTDLPVFDPVGATNESALWHRGYPLQLLAKREYGNKTRETVHVDIQADFWNGDPDIDAVCRMEHAPKSEFDHSCFPIASNVLSPFNSQNTFLKAEVMKDYFMFPHVGRMDDIWSSYYCQARGWRVIYDKPSVYQARNEHDLTTDMKQEFRGYEQNLRLVEDLKDDPEKIYDYIPVESARAFDLYRKHF